MAPAALPCARGWVGGYAPRIKFYAKKIFKIQRTTAPSMLIAGFI
jgi:hypothetical protein